MNVINNYIHGNNCENNQNMLLSKNVDSLHIPVENSYMFCSLVHILPSDSEVYFAWGSIAEGGNPTPPITKRRCTPLYLVNIMPPPALFITGLLSSVGDICVHVKVEVSSSFKLL